jgi:hypothetical protein
MLLRIWIINLILSAAVVFLGLKAYSAWMSEKKNTVETGTAKKASIVAKKVAPAIAPPVETEYQTIVEHNLFWKSRSPYAQKKKETETEPKPATDERLVKLLQETAKRISVYGVMMINEEKRALIKHPTMPILAKPGNRHQPSSSGESLEWVKVGDAVDRFRVREIRPTGVVLAAEGLVFDVVLYDKDKPKERAPEKAASSPVVIDTKTGTEAARPPEEIEGRKETGPDKELPIIPGKQLPIPAAAQADKPEKR